MLKDVLRYTRADLLTFDRQWRPLIRDGALVEVARGAEAEELWRLRATGLIRFAAADGSQAGEVVLTAPLDPAAVFEELSFETGWLFAVDLSWAISGDDEGRAATVLYARRPE